MAVDAKIMLLPGDGIGPEVVGEAERVLERVAKKFSHTFHFTSGLIGGCAMDATGDPLPQATIDACRASDAMLLGAVGGPKWDDPNAKTRPEAGLLKLRKEFQLYANLRPIVTFPELIDASPLKRHVVEGTDILFFRELPGGFTLVRRVWKSCPREGSGLTARRSTRRERLSGLCAWQRMRRACDAGS